MDERSLKALEFDKIRDVVATYAFSSLGAARAQAMTPAPEEAPRTLAEAAEMMAYAAGGHDIPLAGLCDIGPLVERLSRGGVLTGAELIRLRDFLLAAARARRAFGDEGHFPRLSAYAAALAPLPSLAAAIAAQIDDDGSVRDDATPQLARLRKHIGAKRDEIHTALERLLKTPKITRALREPIVTQRGGRYVLPVRTDSMGSVRGIVHAHSSSGVTAFVEPMPVVELNNELEGLAAEEQAEAERILRALSARCGAEADSLATDAELLAELDFVAARAGYGLAYNCIAPKISSEAKLNLKSARHPLLIPSRGPGGVVPIDFALGDGYVGMVISGPNNGGKTVALKTAGLLAAMALAGVPIPAGEGTTVGAFAAIFADIGDESSLEGNLSTFTAHMANVTRVLAAADGRTLTLLDELGVGTSPTYGVAIATAVLRRLKAMGARVACSTHYDELKKFAWEEEGFVNAAVEFDGATLAPTYVLKTGRPGTSEAFAILQRLAFPPDVIEDAARALGAEEVSLAGILGRLEQKEAEANALAEKLKVLQAEWAAKLAALDEEREAFAAKAAHLREEAYAEATKVLRDARRQANVIIREIRARADVADAEELQRRLLAAEKAAAAERERLSAQSADETPAATEIAAGDWVTVRGTKTKGKVVEVAVARRQARVRFGGVDAWVNLGDLTSAKEPGRKGTIKIKTAGDVAPTLNVIGSTVEEAVTELGAYLERAVVAGLPSVEVIHGHGTGRLREGLRNYLRSHGAVASFGPGAGGNEGVTVVRLRKG